MDLRKTYFKDRTELALGCVQCLVLDLEMIMNWVLQIVRQVPIRNFTNVAVNNPFVITCIHVFCVFMFLICWIQYLTVVFLKGVVLTWNRRSHRKHSVGSCTLERRNDV